MLAAVVGERDLATGDRYFVERHARHSRCVDAAEGIDG
jgi:hypothetical protein